MHGHKPHERGLNEKIEEEKERAAKEALLKEQQKNQVTIPKYHFHTKASVSKVENCVNKSNTKRVKVNGLQAMIHNDNGICYDRLKDIDRIDRNIATVQVIDR